MTMFIVLRIWRWILGKLLNPNRQGKAVNRNLFIYFYLDSKSVSLLILL